METALKDGELQQINVPLQGEVMSPAAVALSDAERRFQAGFREQVQALAQIRAGELYRSAGFVDFFNYCRSRLDIGRRRAYQLLDAAETVEIVIAKNPDLAGKLTNVEQMRGLSGMKVKDRVRVLEKANKEAESNGKHLTGKLVNEVARKNFGWKPKAEHQREKAAEREKMQTTQERISARLIAFGKHANGITDLYKTPEAMVAECGLATGWNYFEELYDWVQRAREIS